jgi:general secretion pathway protein E
VHTNSAAATITRLIDMGVEDYLLASSLTGVLAQRLVRRLCPACAVPAALPAALERRLAGLIGGQAVRGTVKKACGCPACRNTGFSGRTAVYELIVVTDAIRGAILSGHAEKALAAVAESEGMVPMLKNGISKVFAGETTLEEVLRVTRIGDATL